MRLLGIGAALVGSVLAAGAMLLVKQLVRTEASITIVVWFSLTSILFSGLTFLHWVPMDGESVLLMLAAGVMGGLAQVLMTESSRHAAASLVAPFEYMSVIVSIAVGYALFGDIPSAHMVLGGLVVVCSGLLIAFAEMRSAQRRRPGRFRP